MKDSRLIGTWKSDGRKTAKEIAARRDIPASKKVKLRHFFGKLELRYTESRCYSRLGDYVSVNRTPLLQRMHGAPHLLCSTPLLESRLFTFTLKATAIGLLSAPGAYESSLGACPKIDENSENRYTIAPDKWRSGSLDRPWPRRNSSLREPRLSRPF